MIITPETCPLFIKAIKAPNKSLFSCCRKLIFQFITSFKSLLKLCIVSALTTKRELLNCHIRIIRIFLIRIQEIPSVRLPPIWYKKGLAI